MVQRNTLNKCRLRYKWQLENFACSCSVQVLIEMTMKWNGCLAVEFCRYGSHQSHLVGPFASVIGGLRFHQVILMYRGRVYFRSPGSLHCCIYLFRVDSSNYTSSACDFLFFFLLQEGFVFCFTIFFG